MIIVSILIVAVIIMSYYFSEKIINIKVYDEQGVIDLQLKDEVIEKSDLTDHEFETVELQSKYGYSIFAKHYVARENNDKVVLISHGVTVSTICSLKYMKVFKSLGYDCLLIDHRSHGHSGGKFVTFGYYEKEDMKSWIDYLRDLSVYQTIGIHGESMGSAIALQYAGLKGSDIDFLVVDCPFDTLWHQLAYRLKIENHLPAFPILYLTSLITYIRAGFWISDVSPINSIKTANCPILFIHSKEDRYIPMSMTENLFHSYNGVKKLYRAEHGGHAESLRMNKEEYIEELKSFISDIKK